MKAIQAFSLLFVNTILIDQSVALNYSAERYKLVTYNDIDALMNEIKESSMHDTVFKIKNVFDEYPKIPKVKCPSSKQPHKHCESYLIEIANFDNGPDFVNSLPTVFLIAGFHGNEVTGTNALYNFIKIVYKYYYKNTELYALLENVRLLILPTANVNGFDRLDREERINGQSHDPNRDFPFDLIGDQECFVTTTAMVIDAIFRDNMIVGCFTFHGGANSITYPWGNFAHQKNPKTGDNVAFSQVAKILQTVAGENPDLSIYPYDIGLMQDIVYDVHGGFEDWAYGASWDSKIVSKTCARYESATPLSNSNLIEYGPETNKAFVYLVEAGKSKIPLEQTLGNELAVFEPLSKDAVWGNVSRNIVMAMKFIEVIQPYLIVLDIQYTETLMLKLAIKGCSTLEINKIGPYEHKVTETSYNEYSNEYVITLLIINTPRYIEEISIKFSCDKDWVSQNRNVIPRSHLVKMRTDPLYNKEHNGFKLSTQSEMSAKILNLKTNELDKSYLHLSPNNVHSMVYSTSFKAEMGDENVYLNYKDSALYIEMEDGTKPEYNVFIAHYGTIGCCHGKSNGERSLRIVDPRKAVEMSQQTFLNLLGHSIEFRDAKTEETKFVSTIELRTYDPYSTLYIPRSGLTCSSQNTKNYYYVTMKQLNPLEVRIELLTNYQGSLIAGLMNRQIFLSKDMGFSSKESGVSNHFGIILAQNANELRLLGAQLKLIDISGVAVFQCNLNVLNPNYSEIDNLNFDFARHKAFVSPTKPAEKTDKGFIVLFIILVLFAIGFLVYINRHNKNAPIKEIKAGSFDMTHTQDPGTTMI